MRTAFKNLPILACLALLPSCPGPSSSTVSFPATYTGVQTIKYTIKANYGSGGSCQVSKDYLAEMILNVDGSVNFKGESWSNQFTFSGNGDCTNAALNTTDNYDYSVGGIHDGKGNISWTANIADLNGAPWKSFGVKGTYNTTTLEASGNVSGESISARGRSYQESYEYIYKLKNGRGL